MKGTKRFHRNIRGKISSKNRRFGKIATSKE
jgi:hypothetical protein